MTTAAPRLIEGTDRIATIHHSVTGLWHPQHQILTCHVTKTIEARTSQDDAVHSGGKRSRVNHLKMPEGGVGQRPTRQAHQVQNSISGHRDEVYQEMIRSCAELRHRG